jgi:hypothetical protein
MKMQQHGLALALAAFLGAPGAAMAAGGGVTGPEVAAILQSEGYKAKVETDSEGDPIIRTSMSGVKVSLLFYDCDKGRCNSLQFSTGLDLDNGTTPTVINTFNKTYRYAAAYVDEENDPFLRYDFDLEHAQAAEHIRDQVSVWEDVLGSFLKDTGFNDE